MLRDSHVLFESVGAPQDLVALLDLLREGVELDPPMTALLLELEGITPISVTAPVMHATMIDPIKELPPETAFRPREASCYGVTRWPS